MIPLFFRFGAGKALLIIGGLFILFGILVAYNPQILILLVSSLFIFIGLVLFSIGLGMYQMRKRRQGMKENVIEGNFWKF